MEIGSKVSTHYEGRQCSKCLTTLRYSSSNTCVRCARDRAILHSKNNPEKKKLQHKMWRTLNKEKIKEEHRNNVAAYRIRAAKYKKNNADKVNYRTQRRRALKAQACPSWLTEWDCFVIQEYYYKAKCLEELTGIKWHVDHIHPLNSTVLCGLHVPWNLQLLPAVINMSKGNRVGVGNGNYI